MVFNLCRLLAYCEGRRAGRQMVGSFKKYRQLFSVDVVHLGNQVCAYNCQLKAVVSLTEASFNQGKGYLRATPIRKGHIATG